MIIAVNTRLLIQEKLEGIGWFTRETLSRITRDHPEHQFLFIFDMDLMRRKEIAVQNVRRQNHCIEKAIKLVENGLPVGQMVTHHFPPEDTQQAFEMVSCYMDGVIKAMIDFS